jgi:iron complex transport system substrate-binding protein
VRAVILFLLGFATLGCGERKDPSEGITDDLGRVVRLPTQPARLISLAPNLTEIVYAAGAGDLLVAVTTADDYPDQIHSLPRISALPVDFESLAGLRPELVLATDQVNSPRDVRTFANLRIPVYFFSFASIDDIPRSMRVIGELTGRYAPADSAATALEARQARLAEDSRNSHRPRVLYLVSSEVLYSVGRGSYVHDMIELAGGTSITRDIPSPAPVLSEEFVLTSEADVIVGTFGADFSLAAFRDGHPSWRDLSAVDEGRVYSVPSDYFHRPGPRVFDGIDTLKTLLADVADRSR